VEFDNIPVLLRADVVDASRERLVMASDVMVLVESEGDCVDNRVTLDISSVVATFTSISSVANVDSTAKNHLQCTHS